MTPINIQERLESLEASTAKMLPTINGLIYDLTKLRNDINKPLTTRPTLGRLPEDYPHAFSHSDWDCKDSPTLFCMYTWYCGECCIFCGNPEERK